METKCYVCKGNISSHDPVRLRACLLRSTKELTEFEEKLSIIEERIQRLERIDKEKKQK